GDEDLGDLEVLLQQQANEESRDRVGLARSRARLDQGRTRLQRGLNRVECRDHSASSELRAFSKGSKTRRVFSIHVSLRGASMPRKLRLTNALSRSGGAPFEYCAPSHFSNALLIALATSPVPSAGKAFSA